MHMCIQGSFRAVHTLILNSELPTVQSDDKTLFIGPKCIKLENLLTVGVFSTYGR